MIVLRTVIISADRAETYRIVETDDGHGVKEMRLHLQGTGYIGEPVSKKTHEKYRLALHELMERAATHRGSDIQWRAPLTHADDPVQNSYNVV